MYTLYYSPGACSMAVHICLLECGQKPNLENCDLYATPRNPALAKVNTRGQVPVLKDGEEIIREGAAQMIYLMDKHASPLLPREGAARARALEWLCWANATLHPAYSRAFGAKRVSQDAAVQEAVLDSACQCIQKLWDDAEAHLANSKYLAGNEPTMADILMAVIANWSPYFPGKITLGANVKRVLREMIARPSFQQAMAAEQVDYKAAA